MRPRVDDVEEHEIRTEGDIVRVRRRARDRAEGLGFGSTDQTRVMTAASELARNAVLHGLGGSCRIETVTDGQRRGIQLVFEDTGPGIRDTEEALRDGFSSGKGLGMGLGGARRLSHEMEIDSDKVVNTRVRWLRWLR